MIEYGRQKPPVDPPFKRKTTDLNTKTNLDYLLQRVEKQNLLIQALIRLMIEKQLTSEEEINQWVDYIDGLDGVVDGRIAGKKGPLVCPSCSRVSRPDSKKCMYCGASFAQSVVETPKPEA